MTHCQCRTIRPDYVRNKESPMFLRKVLSIVKILRKISLKIASRSAIKIETVSGPARDRFYIYTSLKTASSAPIHIGLGCSFRFGA